jgi:hypothetical protein
VPAGPIAARHPTRSATRPLSAIPQARVDAITRSAEQAPPSESKRPRRQRQQLRPAFHIACATVPGQPAACAHRRATSNRRWRHTAQHSMLAPDSALGCRGREHRCWPTKPALWLAAGMALRAAPPGPRIIVAERSHFTQAAPAWFAHRSPERIFRIGTLEQASASAARLHHAGRPGSTDPQRRSQRTPR